MNDEEYNIHNTFFISLLLARVECYDLDLYQNENGEIENLSEIKDIIQKRVQNKGYNQCISDGGVGSTFTMDTPLFVKTCEGFSGAKNGYIKILVGCNYCTGKYVSDKLKLAKEDCDNACMTSNAYCQKPSIDANLDDSWGGKIVNDEECGETLPECLSESSSSSQSEISSSSEDLSSSSQIESSDSAEESSSSEDANSGDESSSSESGDCDEDNPYDCSSASEESSSSEVLCPCTDEDGPCFDDDGICSESGSSSSGESMSSSANANIIACYKPDEYGGCEFSHYVSKERPPMHGEPSLSESDIIFCEYTDNQIYVGYFAHIGVPMLYDERHASFNPCYYDEYNCGNLTSEDAFPIPTLQSPFYGCQTGELDENGCKDKLGIAVYVDKNLQIAERTARWIPSNVTRNQIIAMGDQIIRRESSMVVFYNDAIIGDGYFRNLKSRTLSAAVDFCASIINRYEREHRSSSSTQVQSSCSGEESSSSVIELSSSSELESSSSNNQISSSSSIVEENSSSSVGAETFVSDGNQTYTPDQIFKEGLQNMEDGLCYSLNPERGIVSGWNISYNAQDSWWWREVDCTTGEKVDLDRVGACPGFPLDHVPSDPTSTCFAYNGSCYKCNAERGSECSNSWLWQGTFTSANIGWWYEEVDCENPFERDEFICPDGSVLYKKASKDFIPEEIEEVHNGPTMYYYDALGRSMKRKDAFSVKRAIYYKSQRDNSSQKSGFGTSKQFKVLLKTVSGYVRAKTEVSFSYNTVCSDEQYIPLNVVIELNTSNDDIEVKLEGNDANLKKHEEKHVEIYREYGNDSWVEQSFIYHRMKKSDVCKKIKEDYWPSVETRMRKMLNLQNAWDDEDVNNVSHERINIELEIEKLKKQWQNSSCE